MNHAKKWYNPKRQNFENVCDFSSFIFRNYDNKHEYVGFRGNSCSPNADKLTKQASA